LSYLTFIITFLRIYNQFCGYDQLSFVTFSFSMNLEARLEDFGTKEFPFKKKFI
jgi:hypothetical protein